MTHQETLRCTRCGYRWAPRVPGRPPHNCARCRSPYWHLPRIFKKPPKRKGQTQSGFLKGLDLSEAQEFARQMGRKAWVGTTAKQRREFMSEIAKRPRPSRVIKRRCPCGKYSEWLAVKRGHRCKTETALGDE